MTFDHRVGDMSDPTIPEVRRGRRRRGLIDQPLSANPLAFALELERLKSQHASNHAWPATAAVFTIGVVEMTLARFGSVMLKTHRHFHRRRGRPLCEGDCAARDLCAWLALVLDTVGAPKVAPRWMLIRESVSTFTGVVLLDQADFQRIIRRDLARLRVLFARPTLPDRKSVRAFVGSHGAVCNWLAHGLVPDLDHPAEMSKLH